MSKKLEQIAGVLELWDGGKTEKDFKGDRDNKGNKDFKGIKDIKDFKDINNNNTNKTNNTMEQTEKSLTERLLAVQAALKAPKDKNNDFGHYKYRSAESILTAAKPLLVANGLVLMMTDAVEQVADRVYIRATVAITDGKDTITTTAYAREEKEKKGMDASQVTGAASSYARKYALSGLLAIDDNKDADALNTSAAYTEKPVPQDVQELFYMSKQDVEHATTTATVKEVYGRVAPTLKPYKKLYKQFWDAVIKRGQELKEKGN